MIIANGCGEQKEDMLPLLSYYITLNQFVELTTANSKEFLNKLIENINKRPVNKVTNELAAV